MWTEAVKIKVVTVKHHIVRVGNEEKYCQHCTKLQLQLESQSLQIKCAFCCTKSQDNFVHT